MNNRIIPNRPASREAYKPQQKQEKESALDFFKDTWNKREAFANDTKTVSTDEYLRNLSVKNTYGTGWTPVRNTTKEQPLKDLMNTINECRVLTDGDDIGINVEVANRIGAIDTGKTKLEYANCTKVEEIKETTKDKYKNYISKDFRLFNLYRWNPAANRDTINMVIACK